MNPIKPFTFDIHSLDGMEYTQGTTVFMDALVTHYNNNVVDAINKLIEAQNALQ